MNKQVKINIIRERNIYFSNWKQYFKSKVYYEETYIIWKYVYYLRRLENSSNIFSRVFWRRLKNKIGNKSGLNIGEGALGWNARIWHIGNIVINSNARLGTNCILHGDNCIGNNGKSAACPKIGNNVDIGVGAVVIGDVEIADGITIAAGAVVNKSFLENGITIGGVPARKIK